MKRTILGLTGTLLMFAVWVLPGFTADVAKIGVVDFQRFLTESNIGKAAQTKIETEGAKMEKDLKEQGGAIEALEKKIEADALVVSEDKREEQVREYRIKISDLQALQKKYALAFKKMEQQLISDVQKEASALAEDLGKKEGYLLLIEKNAIIYFPAAIDVTDRLIQFANAKPPATGKQ